MSALFSSPHIRRLVRSIRASWLALAAVSVVNVCLPLFVQKERQAQSIAALPSHIECGWLAGDDHLTYSPASAFRSFICTLNPRRV